jgi:hypothetical protein
LRANYSPFGRPLVHLGHHFHRSAMLGLEPWRVTSGPDMREVQALASKGCQGHSKAYNGPTPGKTATIEVQRNGGGLLNTLETHTRRIAYTPSHWQEPLAGSADRNLRH